MLGGKRCRLRVHPWAAADPPQATTKMEPVGRIKLRAPRRLCGRRAAPGVPAWSGPGSHVWRGDESEATASLLMPLLCQKQWQAGRMQ